MKKLLILLAVGILLSGCANSIKNISENYAETMDAVKNIADISAKDWLFGSGIIQAAIPAAAVPAWVINELKKVDSWFIEKKDLSEFEIGYIVGLRLRLAGPVIVAAIRQYAPGILSIAQVSMVFAFIGL